MYLIYSHVNMSATTYVTVNKVAHCMLICVFSAL